MPRFLAWPLILTQGGKTQVKIKQLRTKQRKEKKKNKPTSYVLVIQTTEAELELTK